MPVGEWEGKSEQRTTDVRIRSWSSSPSLLRFASFSLSKLAMLLIVEYPIYFIEDKTLIQALVEHMQIHLWHVLKVLKTASRFHNVRKFMFINVDTCIYYVIYVPKSTILLKVSVMFILKCKWLSYNKTHLRMFRTWSNCIHNVKMRSSRVYI